MNEPNSSVGQALSHCHCHGTHNVWAERSHKQIRPVKLAAYLRYDAEPPSREEQLDVIHEYCEKHGYEVVEIFEDEGTHPGGGLARAMQACEHLQGVVASDLERFVRDHGDRLRDLKPFLHHFFCSSHRRLLSVKEGVDTSSALGQANALEILNAVK